MLTFGALGDISLPSSCTEKQSSSSSVDEGCMWRMAEGDEFCDLTIINRLLAALSSISGLVSLFACKVPRNHCRINCLEPLIPLISRDSESAQPGGSWLLSFGHRDNSQ